VVAEAYKGIVHSGDRPSLFHYRETRGVEIDLLIEKGLRLDSVEIKSGATLASDFFHNLQRFAERLTAGPTTDRQKAFLVYGGDTTLQRSSAQVLSWRDVEKLTAD
jgi:hypothetical protein